MEDSHGLRAQVIAARLLDIDPSSWRGQGYRSGFWRFYFHEAKGASVCNEGSGLNLVPGGVYLIPSGVTFDIACEREMKHLYIHFDVLGIPSAQMEALFSRPFRVPGDDALRPAVRRLWAHLADERICEPKASFLALAVVYDALAIVLQSLPDAEVDAIWGPNPRLEAVLPAVHAIHSAISSHIGVPDLAAICGMSREHFTKRFREAVGATPIQYIHQCRVKLAEQRLLFSDHSMEQIADECGFGTREYLTRVFTRLTGCSPVAYRSRRNV